MDSKKNVFVIYGGYSEEADVSVRSGKNVINNIDTDFFNVYEITFLNKEMYAIVGNKTLKIDFNDFSFTIDDITINPNYCLIAVHGTPGENGKLQALFELIDLPYFSVNAAISSLTFNKYHTVCVAKVSGINVAENYYINTHKYNIDDILNKISFPFFVKPCKNGSSIGVGKAYDKLQAIDLINNALKIDDEILIEKAIHGREFTMAVFRLNNKLIILPISEALLESNKIDFWGHESKTNINKHIGKTPAELDEVTLQKTELFGEKIYNIFGSMGIMRIDFILNKENNELYLLEINTIPGMSPQSVFPKMLSAMGLPFKDFLTQIINEGISNHKK